MGKTKALFFMSWHSRGDRQWEQLYHSPWITWHQIQGRMTLGLRGQGSSWTAWGVKAYRPLLLLDCISQSYISVIFQVCFSFSLYWWWRRIFEMVIFPYMNPHLLAKLFRTFKVFPRIVSSISKVLSSFVIRDYLEGFSGSYLVFIHLIHLLSTYSAKH